MRDKLLIIDGNNIACRAWFTSNLYGFFNMSQTAIRRLRPTHLAMAFDGGSNSWRKRLYPDYKAGRGTDEARNEYIDGLVEATIAAGVKVSRIGEADDVIATLATHLASKDLRIEILSNDGDMLALVTRHVKVISSGSTFSDFIYFDEREVVKKLGVFPCQVADLKSMEGDKSDNIPGVKGVGRKGACAALAAHKDVTGILNAVADDRWDRRPRWVSRVKADTESMVLSYRLATLKTDLCIPIEPDLYKCDAARLVRAAAREYEIQGR